MQSPEGRVQRAEGSHPRPLQPLTPTNIVRPTPCRALGGSACPHRARIRTSRPSHPKVPPPRATQGPGRGHPDAVTVEGPAVACGASTGRSCGPAGCGAVFSVQGALGGRSRPRRGPGCRRCPAAPSPLRGWLRASSGHRSGCGRPEQELRARANGCGTWRKTALSPGRRWAWGPGLPPVAGAPLPAPPPHCPHVTTRGRPGGGSEKRPSASERPQA